jgi:glycine betaine/proline transport system substrate-binding protein
MVLALIADEGAGDTGGEAVTGTALPGEGVTITIAVNPWTGSAVNANVAKVLLEQQLGYTVELVEIDEFAQFPALSTGELDATLEVWPSGHAEDYATYIDGDGSVVDGGELGVVGNIGWFTPTYVVEANPEVATWEGLNDAASLFATAETGDKGQMLDGDPSFVSYDAEIIENLGLNYELVVAGSEAALLSELEQAYANEEPILLYWYTPHWANQQYDMTEVELPAVTDECLDAALNNKGDGYACDYAEDVLYKAFSAGLRVPLGDDVRELGAGGDRLRDRRGRRGSGGRRAGLGGREPDRLAALGRRRAQRHEVRPGNGAAARRPPPDPGDVDTAP